MISEETMASLKDKLLSDEGTALKDVLKEAYALGVARGGELAKKRYLIEHGHTTTRIRIASSDALLATFWYNDDGLDERVAQELANTCVEILISKDKEELGE